MPRAANPAVSVERFFQFSILGLVASGFLAVAGSGYLDQPTLALTTAGLVLRALLILGVVRFHLSERFLTVATLAYAGFFPLDYAFLSRGFLEATVHLVFFLAVMKILSAKSHRDYLYTSTIAFLELLAAAILSASPHAISGLLPPSSSARMTCGRSIITRRKCAPVVAEPVNSSPSISARIRAAPCSRLPCTIWKTCSGTPES